jgi:hypothetical protein
MPWISRSTVYPLLQITKLRRLIFQCLPRSKVQGNVLHNRREIVFDDRTQLLTSKLKAPVADEEDSSSIRTH